MKRREFIALVGGTTVTGLLPLAARGQQAAMPVIGFLRNTDAAGSQELVSAFRHGVGEGGYVEGQNVRIEYRWTDNDDGRLPALAADLVKSHVAVIAAGGGTTVALAAKAATPNIPIVFELGGDPVKLGLVTSLNRPGGNLTGVALFANVIESKRVEFLCDLVPTAKTIALLVNDPDNPVWKGDVNQVEGAAKALGVSVEVLTAPTEDQIDSAFASLHRSNARGLIVVPSPLFVANRSRIVNLAARYAMPAVYPFPSFPKAGGLMSYGDDLAAAFRQVGNYTARILKGEKPSDLPVVQPSKFELVLNLKTAKSLGLNVPPKLLALADQVIE